MALGNSVAIVDIDGDGKFEFVNQLFFRPYRPAGVNLGPRVNLIEVLEIP
jgi:hypothetical protein